MKKTRLSWIYILPVMLVCLYLLPTKVSATGEESVPPTEVTVTFNVTYETQFTLTLQDGEAAYVTADQNKLASKWEEVDEPLDNYAKLEYDVDTAILKVTFMNFVADFTDAGGYSLHGIEFPVGKYSVAIELIGDNLLHHSKSSCIKANNAGGMTITGIADSSLTINMGTADAYGAASGALWANGGDLTIKNTTLNFNIYTATSSKHNAILSTVGNVLLENVTIDSVMNNRGNLVFMGLGTAKFPRYTQDPDETRTVTVKDCKITSDSGSAIFCTTSAVVLNNTELKAVTSNAPLFEGLNGISNAPVIEGEYTAMVGLKKNAEKPEKWKEYDPKKLGAYTFLYIVPGDMQVVPDVPDVAAPTEVKVTFNITYKKFSVTLQDGEAAYVTADQNKLVSKWEEIDAPTDNYAKLEYDVETANLKVTFHNFVADFTEAGGYTTHGIEFPVGEYAVAMELIGDNLLHHGKSSCIKTNNNGGLTITGTEGSSLTLNMGTADALGVAAGALWANGGDLIIKNTALNFNIYTATASQHNAILSTKGNVLLENATINNIVKGGGHLVFMGLGTAKFPRYTQDPDETRTVTVKDCKITSDSGSAVFRTTSPVALNNTELKAITDNAPLFSGLNKYSNAPVIEGEYTAVGSMAENAEISEKWEIYESEKLTTYTFLYIVPGNVQLIPYTVVFEDWDGTVISTNAYYEGDEVVVPADPTRAADDAYTYTFAGWDKVVSTICNGSITYTATYTAVKVAVPGDIDGDAEVTRNDVISLLLHVTMPGRFPLNAEADFNGDGQTTRDDVIRLLLHVTMPNRFPLEVQAAAVTNTSTQLLCAPPDRAAVVSKRYC